MTILEIKEYLYSGLCLGHNTSTVLYVLYMVPKAHFDVLDLQNGHNHLCRLYVSWSFFDIQEHI